MVCKGIHAAFKSRANVSKSPVPSTKRAVRFSSLVEFSDPVVKPTQFLSYWGWEVPFETLVYPVKNLEHKHRSYQRAKMGRWLKGTDPMRLVGRAHDKAIGLFLELEDDCICFHRPASDFYVSKFPCMKKSFLQCKFAMNVIRVSDDSFIRSWILDSGASEDVAPRELCHENMIKSARLLDNELTLTTAGGPISVTHSVHCKISSTGESVDALLLDNSPALLSMGLRCLRDGWTFLWVGFSEKPILVSPCWTKFLHCAVKDFIPYLVDGVTNLNDIDKLSLEAAGASTDVTPALLQSLRKMAACASSIPDNATIVQSVLSVATEDDNSGLSAPAMSRFTTSMTKCVRTYKELS